MFHIVFLMYSIYSWISDTEYEPSGNSNSAFHIRAVILSLLFLQCCLIFLHK